MKKLSTSLAIKEMQIKTTLRAHLALVRTAVIKRATSNAGEDAGRGRTSYILLVRIYITPATVEISMEIP
jgi:hypothetical protein